MYKTAAAQIKVDERRHHTDLAAAQPRAHVLKPVLHEEGDALALLETGGEQKVGHLVAVLVQLNNLLK